MASLLLAPDLVILTMQRYHTEGHQSYHIHPGDWDIYAINVQMLTR